MANPKLQRRDTEAPKDQDYEFYTLTGENPIRLLCLEPDATSQTLHYTLKHADLSSDPPPKYNCLSYTWAYPQWGKLSPSPPDITHAGDRKNPMKCDQKTIYITDNLKFALARLWEDMASIGKEIQERIPIWIDAVCIHQESTEERNSQVAKMDEIYRNAEKVIVWLGPEDKNYTPLAIDVIERLSAVSEENWDADVPDELDNSQVYTILGINPISMWENEWAALGELFMRTWFSRIWVIQETFEAKDVIVYCGEHELSWQQIVVVSKVLAGTGLGRALMKHLSDLTHFDGDDGGDADDDEMESECGADVNADYVSDKLNNQWLFESLREQKETVKLETLLVYARYFSATGHLDFVYAVRGMWKAANHQSLRESIKPDYDIPVEDVFTAAAFASAIEMGDLNLLSLVEDHSLRAARAREERAACKKQECTACQKEKDPERKGKMCSKHLPSWVPDWSITPIAETLCMNPRQEKGFERWTASKGVSYTPPAKPIERELRVTGTRITIISRKAAREPSIIDSIDGTEIFDPLRLLSDLLEDLAPTPSDLIDAFWRTIIKDTYCGEEAGDEARKAFTSFLAVRIYKIEELLSQPTSPPLEVQDPQTLPIDDSPLAILEALLNKISAKDTTSTIPTYQTIRQIIEKWKSNTKYTGVNEEDKLFAESFRKAYVGRRLFCTAEDELTGVLLGIGPESLKKGDEVWVIAGADVPMILRPKGEGKWNLVGECYVHGIMRGEAVQNIDGGGNIQDKKGRKKVMDIVLV